MFNTRFLAMLVFFAVVALVSPAIAADFTIMQGTLIDEECLKAKTTPCLLERYAGQKLILLTLDRNVYRIQEYGVPDWKLQKAFGQLVVVKGLKEDDKIMVTNLAQITGDAKLTKACK